MAYLVSALRGDGIDLRHEWHESPRRCLLDEAYKIASRGGLRLHLTAQRATIGATSKLAELRAAQERYTR